MYGRDLIEENFVPPQVASEAVRGINHEAKRVNLEPLRDANGNLKDLQKVWSLDLETFHFDRELGDVSAARVRKHLKGYYALELLNEPLLSLSGRLPIVAGFPAVGQVVAAAHYNNSLLEVIARENIGLNGKVLELKYLGSITRIREELGKCLSPGEGAFSLGPAEADCQRLGGYMAPHGIIMDSLPELGPGDVVMSARDFIEQSTDYRSVGTLAKLLAREGFF